MPDALAFFERNFSIELAENAALLIALVYIHSLVFRQCTEHKSRVGQFLVGVVLGVIGIMVMMASITYEPGVVFDTRSVLLAIIGLFFGPVTALVAMVMTAVFRYYQGGAGAVTGVSVIITTTVIGMLWRRWRYPALDKLHWVELYLFGVVVHLAMLLCFFIFMPWDMASRVVGSIWVPVLLVYPLATAVLGRLMNVHIERSQDMQTNDDNRARLDRILKASNDAWWEWDLRTNVLDYSPRWWGMLGMEPNEIEPTPELWEQRLHPDDHSRVLPFFNEVLQAGRTQYEVEFRLQHKAGHYVSVISRGYVEYDELGKAARVSGTNVDISALRRAIREVEHTKALLETAGRIARLGYWEFNFETGLPYWSDMTCVIHDMPPGTQLDLNKAWTFFSDEHARTLKEAWARCIDHDETFEVKCQLNTATGRQVWVFICGEPVRNEEGMLQSLRGIIQDIDSQEKIRQARLESERNYREIFDATADAIFLHDRETGQLIDVNETMLRMYGFKSRQDALKSSLAELSSGVEPYTMEQAKRNLAMATCKHPHVFEWHARRRDGQLFWVEVSLRSATISGQKRLLATVRDISRRKTLENQIRHRSAWSQSDVLPAGLPTISITCLQ